MKLSFKIFAINFILVMSLLSLFGFIIISNNFENNLKLEKMRTLKDNSFVSTIITSMLMNDLADNTHLMYDQKINSITDYYLNIFQNISNNGEVLIGNEKKMRYCDEDFLKSIDNEEQVSRVITNKDKYYYLVITKLNFNEENIYIEHLTDLSNVYEMRSDNYHIYMIAILLGSIISSSILFIFALYITAPLSKLSKSFKKLKEGDYSIRQDTSLKSMKSEELVFLANEFNKTSEIIENHIKELEDYNQRQEDFISRFTHELKTPLTSIIGYADILRTYDIDPKKRQEMSNYIYKEGKRLESLSMHLLKLIILKNDDFEFIEYNSKVLFREIDRVILFLAHKYEITIKYDCDEALLIIEPVLLKSLIYNLVDNACKASVDKKDIVISGKIVNRKYEIMVEDHGKGIANENIKKIIEPFFMEDKSRSRKLGGAGLGLSLANEIAKIHRSNLSIESKVGKGTKISFEVGVKNEDKI